MNSKQLIAVAAMALSGAAMAQSSVTVYGRLDASIGSVKEGNIGEAIGVTKLFANNMTTSRIGFKGTEDLGGGLSALSSWNRASLLTHQAPLSWETAQPSSASPVVSAPSSWGATTPRSTTSAT